MDRKNRIFRIINAALCGSGLVAFSFFIHYEFPVRLLSFACLIFSAFIISRELKSWSVFKEIFGDIRLSGKFVLISLAAIILGFSLAALYSFTKGMPLILYSLSGFSIVAVLIGTTEELIFRGFLQGYLKTVNVSFSILFGSFFHTVYKCCLFLAPVHAVKIDLVFLSTWTFVFGILFGILKQYSGSIFRL
jgi:membrane protease YdiL (CAAX protease family)